MTDFKGKMRTKETVLDDQVIFLSLLSNKERITTSFEELNGVVFSESFTTLPKINFLTIHPLNDRGVENNPVMLRTQDDGVII